MAGGAERIAERASQLAHELNNVFTPIEGYASLIREELVAEPPSSLNAAQLLLDIDVILAAARRGAGLTTELMRIAHQPDHPSP